ncbi:neuroparsin-A-like [Copidosoma floridanum]|uniref:neuroparsin-A-like n=1 Tax=Copidosoma floridanum TaxID=29053 RepID=UPI0006C96E76|nr:neuroparsin-A-like [Copidosoma floridanum]
MPVSRNTCCLTLVVLLVLLLRDALTLSIGRPYPTIIERSEQRSECESCAGECDKCKYGHAFSRFCGVEECLKGPGESCGGMRNKYGECGDGMYCRCNKCNGCSSDTLECHSVVCPIYETRSGHPVAHTNSLMLLDK